MINHILSLFIIFFTIYNDSYNQNDFDVNLMGCKFIHYRH